MVIPEDDVRSPQVFHDDCTFGAGIFVQPGSFGDDEITQNANKRINAGKVVHRVDLEYRQKDGQDVVSETTLLRVCRGAGQLVGVGLRPTTAPNGGDKAYTVDVQKAADASSAFSTLLDSVITVDSSSVNETRQTTTLIADPTTDANDAIRVVVATSGSTGNQGQGFILSLYYEEQPS